MFFLKENFIIYISTKRCHKWVFSSFKYEVEYMVWHSQQIYRGFLCHCFCCCGYIFRNINWHILSGLFPLVFAISLAIVKTNVKNVFWKFFFQNLHAIFFLFFFLFFVFVLFVLFACYLLELGFVFKTEICPLGSEFLTGLCYA